MDTLNAFVDGLNAAGYLISVMRPNYMPGYFAIRVSKTIYGVKYSEERHIGIFESFSEQEYQERICELLAIMVSNIDMRAEKERKESDGGIRSKIFRRRR